MIPNRTYKPSKDSATMRELNELINEINAKINSIPTPPSQLPQIKLLVTQSGTDAPVVTVFEEIGDTGLAGVTWFYSDVGEYYSNEMLDFSDNEVHIVLNNGGTADPKNVVTMYYDQGYFNLITSKAYINMDDILFNHSVTITVKRKAEIVILP